MCEGIEESVGSGVIHLPTSSHHGSQGRTENEEIKFEAFQQFFEYKRPLDLGSKHLVGGFAALEFDDAIAPDACGVDHSVDPVELLKRCREDGAHRVKTCDIGT